MALFAKKFEGNWKLDTLLTPQEKLCAAGNFTCGICMGLLNDPIMPKCKSYCQSTYCRGCLEENMRRSYACPICREVFDGTSINRALAAQIDATLVKCPLENCKCKVEFGYLGEHVSTHTIAQAVAEVTSDNAALTQKINHLTDDIKTLREKNESLAEKNAILEQRLDNSAKYVGTLSEHLSTVQGLLSGVSSASAFARPLAVRRSASAGDEPPAVRRRLLAESPGLPYVVLDGLDE